MHSHDSPSASKVKIISVTDHNKTRQRANRAYRIWLYKIYIWQINITYQRLELTFRQLVRPDKWLWRSACPSRRFTCRNLVTMSTTLNFHRSTVPSDKWHSTLTCPYAHFKSFACPGQADNPQCRALISICPSKNVLRFVSFTVHDHSNAPGPYQLSFSTITSQIYKITLDSIYQLCDKFVL